MRVLELNYSNFRNLKNEKLTPQPGVNIIYGNNAQGKTNLIEAIWLFTGLKSFRGAKDNELIAFNTESYSLQMQFNSQNREQTASIKKGAAKSITLNGVKKTSTSALYGNFCAIVFSPAHLQLVKDGPALRRRFIDDAIEQIKPAYNKIILQYEEVLQKRNSLIKNINQNSDLYNLLDIYDEQLITVGQRVYRYRSQYIEALTPYVVEINGKISHNNDKIGLHYKTIYSSDTESIRKSLTESRQIDIARKMTTVGAHRDDLEITINDMSARQYGSQGQQRSAVLSLKLAEAQLLNLAYDEQPVILLDDVLSELDIGRQEYILNHLENAQIFITCCDAENIKKFTNGSTFNVCNGEIV